MRICLLKTFKYIAVLAVYLFVISSSSAQQDRDPFSPTTGAVITKISDDKASGRSVTDSVANPLTTAKLSTFKVIGVIIADNKKIAAVKALSGLDYIVEEGADIGSDGGKITEIKYEGVVVSDKDGRVFIPVSNKLEVKVDKKS